jgi:hypothetical protein
MTLRMAGAFDRLPGNGSCGLNYCDVPLFVVRRLYRKPIPFSSSMRAFHASGDRRVDLCGRVVEVAHQNAPSRRAFQYAAWR